MALLRKRIQVDECLMTTFCSGNFYGEPPYQTGRKPCEACPYNRPYCVNRSLCCESSYAEIYFERHLCHVIVYTTFQCHRSLLVTVHTSMTFPTAESGTTGLEAHRAVYGLLLAIALTVISH